MPEDQQPISKNEFYLVQKNVSDRIKNVETHIDEKYTDIMSGIVRIEGKADKTNGRVRWLEKMIWCASGAILILGWLYVNNFLHCLGQTICQTPQQLATK